MAQFAHPKREREFGVTIMVAGICDICGDKVEIDEQAEVVNREGKHFFAHDEGCHDASVEGEQTDTEYRFA